MAIKNLFDPSKDIYRTIEKVITYGAAKEERLKAEITEYVVTDNIEDQFEELLGKMQLAMEQGEENEIGVWVSGFYGSGKSSFTKYLGLALDEKVEVDGVRFLKYLQDRMDRPQPKALLNTVSSRYRPAVIFLDLASEMLAGAAMEDVSSVLYYKVLQWAGYSRNLKVAALEQRLQKDDRYQEFTDRVESELGVPWTDVQNDPLVIDSLLPDIAHQMYPELFKTPTSFNTETADFVRFENERVEEMVDIVRRISGRQHILFIIDEVGQYVGQRRHLILNLDGLAKNLKAIGDGKVWIIATAQQTLTEDDERAALNSPDLFKLSARFPIQIDLESRDIREICYRRLLGKSPAGERALGKLFDGNGQELRHNTKLQDARPYDTDFDKTTFVNLYPFLPAHFDILLHLLGALAKSTGGLGLRSAIKVIQDILVEGPEGGIPVADQPVGWLATTETLYDALERDIRRTAQSIHSAVSKALARYPDSDMHLGVAKTVAVLQILGNMPVTAQNVTSLMHPAIDAPSRHEGVADAINDLINDPIVPFGEKEGNLCFFSEKINDIDQERAQIPLRTIETRRIHNEALREVFNPLPSTRLHGSLAVTSGLKAASGAMMSSLAGERETVQMVVELVDPADYGTSRARLIEESRGRDARSTVFLLGRRVSEIDGKVADIYRCQEIARRYRSDPDQEVREYCTDQADRAAKLAGELQHTLGRGLSQGSFIFRGQVTAADTLDPDLLVAAKAHLAHVAGQVFDRYNEAPIRAETALAERFLRVGNLNAVTTAIDPLGLVQMSGGKPNIERQQKALVSIRDYVDRNGLVEGRQFTNAFTSAPFGWSQDTLRYLIAALLIAGEVKLRVSGRDVTAIGQQAIDALRTNNAFKSVGVALRDESPSIEMLARASQRLTDLIGETVFALEHEISKAAAKHFPRYQHRFGPLAEKLKTLGLPGADTVVSLNQDLADLLLTDASDATQRLGGEESALYDSLIWATEVDNGLRKGLEDTVRHLQRHLQEINALPGSGVPGELRAELEEDLDLLVQRLGQDNFCAYAADLNTLLTDIRTRTRDAAQRLADAQVNTILEAAEDLQRLPEWSELTQEEQSGTLSQLDALTITAAHDLNGLKRLLGQEYVIQTRVSDFKEQVTQLGYDRTLERLRAEMENAIGDGRKIVRTINVPTRMESAAQLDSLIQQLQNLRAELKVYDEIEVLVKLVSDD